MRKLIKDQLWDCAALSSPPTRETLIKWINGQTTYLFALAHADDGIIWGYFQNNAWHWSSNPSLNSPRLDGQTLQQLRLFGESGETLIWRTSQGFVGRIIRDNGEHRIDWLDEDHLLWGQSDGAPSEEFALMREGSQGLQHSPPRSIASVGKIATRNYITYDDDGCAFVQASRLMVMAKDK